MIKKVIIINGLGGCGKSTFIEYCRNYAQSNQKSFVIELSSVDFVKEVAEFCGWKGQKETKDREFLHDLKIALEKWDDIPNKKVMDMLDFYNRVSLNYVCFVNIRENYNIVDFYQRCKEKNFDCTTLFISGNQKSNEVQGLVDTNNIARDYEYIIFNDFNPDEYQEQAKVFMDEILGE